MISATSLQAFSNAAPASRAVKANPALLARAQPDGAARQATGVTPALPDIRPGLPPPRGSLLNRTA
jgi:hypothetical protein